MRHLRGFVEHIQETGTKQIILITPPPVDESARIRENKQVSTPTLCSFTVCHAMMHPATWTRYGSRISGVTESRQECQVRYSLIMEQAISDLRIPGLTAAHAMLLTGCSLMQKEEAQEVCSASDLPERTNAVTGRYAAAVRKLGSDLGIPVLDLWTELQRQQSWASYLSDGLHFLPSGSTAVYDLLQAKINEALPHFRYLRAMTLRPVLKPLAAQLDHVRYQAAPAFAEDCGDYAGLKICLLISPCTQTSMPLTQPPRSGVVQHHECDGWIVTQLGLQGLCTMKQPLCCMMALCANDLRLCPHTVL